jgi:hypothetical protein
MRTGFTIKALSPGARPDFATFWPTRAVLGALLWLNRSSCLYESKAEQSSVDKDAFRASCGMDTPTKMRYILTV